MSPDKERKLAAVDLPSELVRQHRVMFMSGTKQSMRVVTDQVREGLAKELSDQLGFPVEVFHVDECGDADAQQAYPVIMQQCATTHEAVGSITEPKQSADSNPSGRRRKPRAPKPE